MAKNSRRQFTEDFKKKVIEAYYNREKTGDTTLTIADKFRIERFYIYKWIKTEPMSARPISTSHNIQKTVHDAKNLIKSESSNSDSRDQVIYQLKTLVADLTLEINELKARLGGFKRYSDRRNFNLDHSDSA
jgi:transposase-like protein